MMIIYYYYSNFYPKDIIYYLLLLLLLQLLSTIIIIILLLLLWQGLMVVADNSFPTIQEFGWDLASTRIDCHGSTEFRYSHLSYEVPELVEATKIQETLILADIDGKTHVLVDKILVVALHYFHVISTWAGCQRSQRSSIPGLETANQCWFLRLGSVVRSIGAKPVVWAMSKHPNNSTKIIQMHLAASVVPERFFYTPVIGLYFDHVNVAGIQSCASGWIVAFT